MVTRLSTQGGRRYRQFGATLALVTAFTSVGNPPASGTPTTNRRRNPQFGRTLALVKTLDSLGSPSGGSSGGSSAGFSRAQVVNNTMEPVTQSTARNFMIFMVSNTDHVTGASGLALTITASKDGAAFATITPTVTDRSNGWYNLALTSSHTDTLGDFACHVTASGADACDFKFPVEAARTGIIATNNDKTGYVLTQAFPPNFSAMAIDTNGRIRVLTGITKNVAVTGFPFMMTDSGTHAPKTGLGSSVTGTVSIDGGGFSSLTNSVSEISGGWYKVDLAAADVNGTFIAMRFTAASSDDSDIMVKTST